MSASAPSVGVALCTYNGAAYLQVQLDSILAQSVRVDEVVVGDDGSSDQTLELLAAFAARAGAQGIRVEVVQHPRNLGYVLNFADALQRCRADIIFLCDQDDAWHPGRVQAYLQRFQADPSLLMLYSDARLVDAAGEPLGMSLMQVQCAHPGEHVQCRDGWAIDMVLLRNFITGATCALRRTLLEQALPIAPRWSHDEWLGIVASLNGGLDHLPQATIDYRQHGGNQIGASRRRFFTLLAGLDLFNAARRQRTAERLQGLVALLQRRGVVIAPHRWQGLSALAWRMAWSRLQLYRRPDVGWRWIAHDAPRLLARLANCSLAGARGNGLLAALAGAVAGWRGTRAA